MQRELVERARRGDHDAYAALAGAAINRLDAAARLILRDPEQAKDAVQNALVRAWRDLPMLRDPERFDAWLHRLLVRSCIDETRRSRRQRLDVELSNLDLLAADPPRNRGRFGSAVRSDRRMNDPSLPPPAVIPDRPAASAPASMRCRRIQSMPWSTE